MVEMDFFFFSSDSLADYSYYGKHDKKLTLQFYLTLFQKSAVWAACVSVWWSFPRNQSRCATALLQAETQLEPVRPTMHYSISKSWQEASEVICTDSSLATTQRRDESETFVMGFKLHELPQILDVKPLELSFIMSISYCCQQRFYCPKTHALCIFCPNCLFCFLFFFQYFLFLFR